MAEGKAQAGIELPSEVAWFLGIIGIAWPAVDEDQVRPLAQHVKTFMDNVDGTRQAASSTTRQMSSAYSGSSYEQLVATWARMSSSHTISKRNERGREHSDTCFCGSDADFRTTCGAQKCCCCVCGLP
jgi:hypothetical protein